MAKFDYKEAMLIKFIRLLHILGFIIITIIKLIINFKLVKPNKYTGSKVVIKIVKYLNNFGIKLRVISNHFNIKCY
jgi:hypothetical protein